MMYVIPDLFARTTANIFLYIDHELSGFSHGRIQSLPPRLVLSIHPPTGSCFAAMAQVSGSSWHEKPARVS